MLEAIRLFNDPYNSFEELSLLPARSKKGIFVLCLAASKTSDIEGISAAGVDAASRRLTPALDAEYLLMGRTKSAASLPLSPRGIVSPAVISRAALQLLKLPLKIIDCGSFQSPDAAHLKIGSIPAESVSSGSALAQEHVRALFESGLSLGQEISRDYEYIVLAECVPAGTSTAYAVLSALGYEVDGLLSSSLPVSNHNLRQELFLAGLAKCKFSREQMKKDPFLALAAFGDPMQAFSAGFSMSASLQSAVFLGGGSQMLAVFALLSALRNVGVAEADLSRIFVFSTGWVLGDKTAGVARLAELLQAPIAAACPDFHKSKHEGLRAYEEGNVKEGVGAGACMLISMLAGFSEMELIEAVDSAYSKMLEP